MLCYSTRVILYIVSGPRLRGRDDGPSLEGARRAHMVAGLGLIMITMSAIIIIIVFMFIYDITNHNSIKYWLVG